MAELTDQEKTMTEALRGVNFGMVMGRECFVAQVRHQGIQTDRQRWWLYKLVHMYRKQVKSDYAVAVAEQWLAEHPEATHPQKPKPEPPPPPPPVEKGPDLFSNFDAR